MTANPSPPRPKVKLGCLATVTLALAIPALVLLVLGISNLTQHDPDLARTQLIGALVLAILAGALWLNGYLGYRRQRRVLSAREAYPDEPWRWNLKWMDGRIYDSRPQRLFISWIMSIGFLGLGLPAGLAGVNEAVHKNNAGGYLGLIFPCAGLGLLIWALRETALRLKFGRGMLELATFPGAIGGQLVGVLHLRRKLQPENGYHLRLACIRAVTRGSGEDSTTTRSILWEDQATMTRSLEADPECTAIPVGFRIPDSCLPTDDGNPKDLIYWTLEVTAQVPGLDYTMNFEVPVFRLANGATNGSDIDPVAAYRAPVAPQTAPSLRGIHMYPTPGGGTEFYFGPARNLMLACMITLVTIGVFGLSAFIWSNGPKFVSIILFALGLLFFRGVLRFWFRTLRIIIERGEVVVRFRTLLLGRSRTFSATEITDIVSQLQWTSNDVEFFRIVLVLASSKRLNTAGGIGSKKETEWLITQMQEALSRP